MANNSVFGQKMTQKWQNSHFQASSAQRNLSKPKNSEFSANFNLETCKCGARSHIVNLSEPEMSCVCDGTHFLFKGVLNAKKEIIKTLVNLKFLNQFCYRTVFHPCKWGHATTLWKLNASLPIFCPFLLHYFVCLFSSTNAYEWDHAMMLWN